MAADPDFQKQLGSWIRQTVAHAMSQRALQLGKDLGNETAVRAAMIEAGSTAQDIWSAALQECGDNPSAPKFLNIVVRRTFDWCFDLLHPSD
jgi:hypothetical protein